MRNKVLWGWAPSRGALRYVVGALAVATVLGGQAAPASATDRPAAAASEKAFEKAARKASERVAREAEAKAVREAEAKASRKAQAKAAREAEAKVSRRAEAKARAKAAAKPDDVQARDVPSPVEATVDDDAASVTITWTLPEDNAAEVAFRLQGTTNIECPETATASGSCSLTEVPPGDYDVQYDEDGNGWVDAGVGAEVPVAPPAEVTVTPTVHGLSIAWEPSASPGVTGYVATAAADGDDPATCSSMDGCAITGLDYQPYAVSVVAKVGEVTSAAATVDATPLPETPAAPTGVTAKLSGPNAITISWNAVTSSYGVPIKYMGGIGTDNWGRGCWDEPMNALTCTVDGLPAGTSYTITAFAIGDVMSEPGRAAAKLTIPLPSSPPADAPRMRPGRGATDPVAGGRITFSGSGYQPFSTVMLAIYSEPVVLGSANVEADGTFTATVTLPDGYAGDHTLLASGVDADGNPRYMTLAVDIGAGGGGGLPVTGPPIVILLLLGAGLVGGGGAVLVAARPRRAAAA
jgi:titin